MILFMTEGSQRVTRWSEHDLDLDWNLELHVDLNLAKFESGFPLETDLTPTHNFQNCHKDFEGGARKQEDVWFLK